MNVQFRDQTGALSQGDDSERFPLEIHILSSQLQASFKRPHWNAVGGNLDLQEYQDVVVARALASRFASAASMARRNRPQKSSSQAALKPTTVLSK